VGGVSTHRHSRLKGRRFGSEIYKILFEDGVSDEHFDTYCEFIRRRENPTEEEKLIDFKKKEEADARRKHDDEERRLQLEKQAEIDKIYTNRLNRLKAKNNICP
jgi:hypothetical protein